MILIPEPNQDEFDGIEIHCVDGVFVKQWRLPRVGLVAPQHSHVYDHLTMLAAGAIKVWKDGVYVGEKIAPTGIVIEAGCKHMFVSTQPDTVLYCIHNADRTGAPDVAERASLEEVGPWLLR